MTSVTIGVTPSIGRVEWFLYSIHILSLVAAGAMDFEVGAISAFQHILESIHLQNMLCLWQSDKVTDVSF